MELVLNNITKKYNDKVALDNISYNFSPGIYGLLGPNGAGKSTMLKLITDNLSTTEGDILLDGISINTLKANYRKYLGYTPQQQNIYPQLTLERFLFFMAALKGIRSKKTAAEEITYYLKMVNLFDVKNKRLGTFSGGMKQRALIAQALLGDPSIIVLDEPTAGLDPKERIRIRNLISKVAQNKIVIIATHVVTDIEFIAKEILLLQQGHIIRKGSPVDLCNELTGKVLNLFIDESDLENVMNSYPVSNINRINNSIVCRVVTDSYDGKWRAETVSPSLEDLYLYLFGDD